MTLDEFRSKYRLQTRLTQGGVASYRAADASGRVVMVHALDSASRDEVDHVRRLVHEVDATSRTKILEIVEVEGAPIIVTEYLQGFETLPQWLELRASTAPPAPAMPAVQPGREPTGGFTQLFGPAVRPKQSLLDSPPVSPAITSSRPPSPETEPAAPTTPEAPGDFTRFFGTLPAGSASSAGDAGPASTVGPPGGTAPGNPTPTPVPAKRTGPAGEFTRLFGSEVTAPTPDPPQAPRPAAAKPDGPKVVVRWRDDTAPEPAPQAPKPVIRWKEGKQSDAESQPTPLRPAGAPPGAPGDFTRLFGPEGSGSTTPEPHAADVESQPGAASALPPGAPAPRAGSNAPGGFTQLLRTAADLPGDPTSPVDGGSTPSLQQPGGGSSGSAESAAVRAPGEFTSLMSGLPRPGAPAAPRVPPGPPGPSEFTRIVSGGPAPRAPSAAPVPSEPAEHPGGRPSLTALFVALGVVLVIGVALVVLFALH